MNNFDLSKLPLPDAIKTVDFDENYQLLLNDFKKRLPSYDADIISDPAVKLLEACAYGLTIYQMRINDAIKSVLISSAKNSDLDQLGALVSIKRAENESDERLRIRIISALEKVTTAGSRFAFEALAMEADARVIDVIAYDDYKTPGVAYIKIQSCENPCGLASDGLIHQVKTYLSSPERKPLGCQVMVSSIKPLKYSINAEVILDQRSDKALVLKTLYESLNEFTKNRHRIGQSVPLSEIYARLNIEGISYVEHLFEPIQSILTSNDQTPFCQSINIEVAE